MKFNDWIHQRCWNMAIFYGILIFALLVCLVAKCLQSFDLCAIGLCLNIIGALVTIFFGFPQPEYDPTVLLAIDDGETSHHGMSKEQSKALNTRNKNWHTRCSTLGIALLLLGFVAQLCYQITKANG